MLNFVYNSNVDYGTFGLPENSFVYDDVENHPYNQLLENLDDFQVFEEFLKKKQQRQEYFADINNGFRLRAMLQSCLEVLLSVPRRVRSDSEIPVRVSARLAAAAAAATSTTATAADAGALDSDGARGVECAPEPPGRAPGRGGRRVPAPPGAGVPPGDRKRMPRRPPATGALPSSHAPSSGRPPPPGAPPSPLDVADSPPPLPDDDDQFAPPDDEQPPPPDQPPPPGMPPPVKSFFLFLELS